jgi:hypothetical protein
MGEERQLQDLELQQAKPPILLTSTIETIVSRKETLPIHVVKVTTEVGLSAEFELCASSVANLLTFGCIRRPPMLSSINPKRIVLVWEGFLPYTFVAVELEYRDVSPNW